MRGFSYVYRIDSGVEVTEWEDGEVPDLKWLQDAVGGYIEHVPGLNTVLRGPGPFDFDGRDLVVSCTAYCNEDGKLNGMDLNDSATALWHQALLREYDDDGKPLYPHGLLNAAGQPVDYLVGHIVVLVGDEAWMRRHIIGKAEEDEYPSVYDWWTGGEWRFPE
jgi:hypothetical protein